MRVIGIRLIRLFIVTIAFSAMKTCPGCRRLEKCMGAILGAFLHSYPNPNSLVTRANGNSKLYLVHTYGFTTVAPIGRAQKLFEPVSSSTYAFNAMKRRREICTTQQVRWHNKEVASTKPSLSRTIVAFL